MYKKSFAGVSILLVLGLSVFGVDSEKTSSPTLFSKFQEFYNKRAGGVHVESGTLTQSREYYSTVSAALPFPNKEFPADLNELLKFFGCNRTAEDIEGQLPDVLRKDGISSARFFSAKTTDVSGREKPQLLSWRQVLRIQSKVGSPAKKVGLEEFWWLTNIYREGTENPFQYKSQNNQVIIVPQSPVTLPFPKKEKGEETAHRLLFAVFAPQSEKYRLAHSTSTSWDAGTVNVEEDRHNPNQEYFVPDSCIQCHGEVFPNGRLNFLDTDYYRWRAADLDDFPKMKEVIWATPENGFQFASFRSLNQRIHTQNEQADPKKDEPAFQTKSIANWLELHPTTLDEIPPQQRGWDGKNEEVVRLLVKYCYRCHGTVAYSVLDGKYIISTKKKEMIGRIGEDMPQDRYLTDPKVSQDLNRLKELLDAVK